MLLCGISLLSISLVPDGQPTLVLVIALFGEIWPSQLVENIFNWCVFSRKDVHHIFFWGDLPVRSRALPNRDQNFRDWFGLFCRQVFVHYQLLPSCLENLKCPIFGHPICSHRWHQDHHHKPQNHFIKHQSQDDYFQGLMGCSLPGWSTWSRIEITNTRIKIITIVITIIIKIITTSAKNITSKVWWDVRTLGGAGGKSLPNASTHGYRSR